MLFRSFTQKFADILPADPAAALIEIGEQQFAALADYPEARAFWWPRFVRIARWFAGFELERRAGISKLHAEIGGRIDIALAAHNFRLTARADRIERRKDGTYAILDYKTGRLPGHDEVKIGLAPQLTLEAAMLRHGGFPGIAAGASVAEIMYVGLKGGEPAGEPKLVKLKDSTPDIEADRAYEKLKQLVSRFADENQPYLPLVLPKWKARYGDYDHLARVKEWSQNGGADEAGGP